jgi:hypothetical protein
MNEIRKTLVCSTAHVSRNVMMILDNDYAPHDIPWLVYSRLEYGWLIRYWPPKLSEDRTAAWRTMPRCMKDVIERAESLGCSMVMFDADADELEGVRTYEW